MNLTERTYLIDKKFTEQAQVELSSFDPITKSAYDINSQADFSDAFKKTISNIPFGKYVEIEIIFNENVTKEKGSLLVAHMPYEKLFVLKEDEKYRNKVKEIILNTKKFQECKFYYHGDTVKKAASVAVFLKEIESFPYFEALVGYADCKFINISREKLASDFLEVYNKNFDACIIS